jgi:hypothetical protein
MSLTQLIYVSTATRELDAEEIRRILDSSVRHNAPNDISGMLLYSHGSFMQVLEGEDSAVDEAMSRIAIDPRHHGISVLSRSNIPAREFSKWAMGFRGIKTEDAASWPGYAPFFEYGFNAKMIGAKPGVALEILNILAGHR